MHPVSFGGPFGFCIRFANGRLPGFNLYEPSLNILNDIYKATVLPYFFDPNSSCGLWKAYICGLAERGRVDWLNRLGFLGINYSGFR